MVTETTQQILVSGGWRQGRGPVLRSVNPFDGSVIATLASASPEDVDDAVRGGHAAMADPAWRGMLAPQRARLLYRVAELITARHEELARLQTLDNGKPISETRALVASAAGTFRYVAATLETLDDTMPVPHGSYLAMSVHEPLGVIAAITPWNSPIASDAQKLAPALAAGNAVVLKPAAWTPLVSLELGRLLLEAGIPPGLVSVLPGDGPVTGQSLVDHPLVRKVSFTGGTRTGRLIGHAAAEKIMPVSLELGGKSPTVVFDDADVDLAVRGVAHGVFSSQGQACVAGSRLFVQRARYEEVLDRLVRLTERIPLGDPLDEATRMGPLVTAEHRDHVAAYVDLARAENGTVVTGGGRPAGPPFDSGFFYRPTIITGLSNAARVCQEEIFGPVLAVLPFEDDDELVALANDSVYGLACGLWTSDYRRAWSVARRIETGTVWINTYKRLSAATPFGGVKESGIGREKGRGWIHAYMAQKSVYWGMDPEPVPWPDPR